MTIAETVSTSRHEKQPDMPFTDLEKAILAIHESHGFTPNGNDHKIKFEIRDGLHKCRLFHDGREYISAPELTKLDAYKDAYHLAWNANYRSNLKEGTPHL